MKLLGWLKGRGWLMVGLVSAALAGAPGCDDAGKKKVDGPDVQEMYGVWMDTIDEDQMAPVYGIWGDVNDDIRPADMDAVKLDAAVYGIWDVGADNQEPVDVYGVWDAGSEKDIKTEPEVMDMYGVFMDTVTPADTKDDDVSAEVYGIWPVDAK